MLTFPELWKTLVIDRRKPHTYRVWAQDGDYRICLHRFESCDEEEAFLHPHAWPMACKILKGGYNMKLSWSEDLIHNPKDSTELYLPAGSIYSMEHKNVWHSVQPEVECFTVMVSGPPWEQSHSAVRTTKGKGLREMTEEELKTHLAQFSALSYCEVT